MLLYPLLVASWSLQFLDRTCAKTTIRLWHELHVEKKIPHDFVSMVSPEQKGFYLGAVKHEEIRAIALCERTGLCTIHIESIANAPQQHDAPHELMKMLRTMNTYSNLKKLRSQPRWYYEDLFYRFEIYEE